LIGGLEEGLGFMLAVYFQEVVGDVPHLLGGEEGVVEEVATAALGRDFAAQKKRRSERFVKKGLDSFWDRVKLCFNNGAGGEGGQVGFCA
jgi:hypothetical protein